MKFFVSALCAIVLSTPGWADETDRATALATSAKWRIVAWNDLGMHCVDGKDYSIYSILPPYNNLHAQVIDATGKLVKNSSTVKVTYEAVADPTGSINRTTQGKTNFWQFVQLLFGVNLAPDLGLAGFRMPGTSNIPQAMKFDTTRNWYSGDGIPISPYDDGGQKNYYPMMRVTARNIAGAVLATTDVVLPVSDEMDCRACHASGSVNTARPSSGWSYLSDPEHDYKMNVLKLHDERMGGSAVYAASLQQANYNSAGLIATVTVNQTPILCARCHASNALGTGFKNISPLTTAVHKHHATVVDPTNNLILDAVDNRSACYRCHPGSVTRCLRGVMGNATAPDGSMLMQCQSCHGGMSTVGKAGRNGWLDEPSCQNCHTGTALSNSGQIRYTSALDNAGLRRNPVDLTFATNANTPAPGTSLYRFSSGHGGLQCESCHGSTHAEYPSSHTNDNLQNVSLQGYAGTLAECSTCHATTPGNSGPHGLHPLGQSWVSAHGDSAERNASQCRACHGLDYRGTVLSATRTSRSFRTERGTIQLAKGTQVGCYNCHNGPRGE